MAGQKVKAIYEYASQEPDDLSFPVGQVITITEEIDADWYEGEYTDASGSKQSGIFPNNFVEKYEPEVPVRPTRAARPKSAIQPQAPPAREEEPEQEPQVESEDERPVPPPPAASKPQPPPVEIPAAAPRVQEDVRSPPSATSTKAPVVRNEPPAASKPAPAEPAASESRKPPPPVAPKSNAFKDRIAAFNAPAAAPPMPFKPAGNQSQPGGFIKKPFVAPPPSSNAYVPPPKHEPVVRPYHRDEDPEIRQRQEDDAAAAEAAGLSADGQAVQEGEEEDAPKPQSLKERIAMLQKQQAEQAQRRAGGPPEKKERKVPVKKASEPIPADDDAELERVRSPGNERESLDIPRDRPRVPSAQRRPQEPIDTTPAMPQHEILSGGEEADQSAAGETTEDDAGTIGAGDDDEKLLPPPRAATAPKAEPDVGDEEDETEVAEGDEEDSMDEDTRRRMELRERMAKMSGGMGMAGMFGAPGGMPMPGAGGQKKRTASAKEREPRTSEDPISPSSPQTQQQRIPMIPVPGMQRVQSPEADQSRASVEKEPEPETAPNMGRRDPDEVPDVEDLQPQPPTRTSTQRSRDTAPSTSRGKPIIPIKAAWTQHVRSYSNAASDQGRLSRVFSSEYDGIVCSVDVVDLRLAASEYSCEANHELHQ